MEFIPICTPFDEKSVELVEKHGCKVLKIASRSFNDRPLLERVAETKITNIIIKIEKVGGSLVRSHNPKPSNNR